MYDINKAASAMGKIGGRKTREKYGIEHFSKAGKKGAELRWARYRAEKAKKQAEKESVDKVDD